MVYTGAGVRQFLSSRRQVTCAASRASYIRVRWRHRWRDKATGNDKVLRPDRSRNRNFDLSIGLGIGLGLKTKPLTARFQGQNFGLDFDAEAAMSIKVGREAQLSVWSPPRSTALRMTSPLTSRTDTTPRGDRSCRHVTPIFPPLPLPRPACHSLVPTTHWSILGADRTIESDSSLYFWTRTGWTRL